MTEENNFGEKLLHKIKEENLQPRPRWQFLLRDYFVWGFGALALISGGLAFSLIIFMLAHGEFDIYERISGHWFEKALIIVPIFWLVCLALFVLLVLYNIKHTKKGYRYNWPAVLFLTIGASALLGGIIYFCGFGARIDNVLGRHAPFYDKIINPGINFWSCPEEGRLVGVIVYEEGADKYLLIDREKKEWHVYTQNAKCLHCAIIEAGKPSRFIGKILSENEFEANEIMPMMPAGGFFNRFNQPSQPGFKRGGPESFRNRETIKEFNI